MASWEDIADEPDVPEPTPVISHSSTGQEAGRSSPTTGNSHQASHLQSAPPKPLPRGGMNDSASISQAYNAAQPKVRILQRQPQANPAQRGHSAPSQSGDADESAARLHANFEQKQRKYEADRRKLFEDGHSAEEGTI